MLCVMTHLYLPTILQDNPRCYFRRILHIICHPQKRCLRCLTFLYFSLNQLSCGPSFHSCRILNWSGVFLYSYFHFLRNSDYLWSYLPQFLHVTFKNLLLFCFISPDWSSRTFSYGPFSCSLIPPNYVLHNQQIYLLRSFYAIFDIFTLRYTLTGLYYSGRTSNAYAFIVSSYFSYSSLILLNLNFKLFSLLNHMSGYFLVSLILHVFHLFVNSFKPSFFLQRLNICQWVPSMPRVHSHFTVSPSKEVFHLGLLLINTKPLCCLHILAAIRNIYPMFCKCLRLSKYLFSIFLNFSGCQK